MALAERMDNTFFKTEMISNAQRPEKTKRTWVEFAVTKNGAARTGRKKRREWKWPSPLWMKVGVCAVACALMLVLKLVETPAASQMVSGVKSAVDDENDITEMLGKLQFVEFPNALEVFSGRESMMVPVSAGSIWVDEDETYAQWTGAKNAEVIAAASGEIRGVGEDEALGNYVRILHENDVETIYYGLHTVSVEQGQPVKRQDTLGFLGEEGELRLSVLQAGRPQSPKDYLNIP